VQRRFNLQRVPQRFRGRRKLFLGSIGASQPGVGQPARVAKLAL
jgi:hypothetical protein